MCLLRNDIYHGEENLKNPRNQFYIYALFYFVIYIKNDTENSN